MQFYIPTTNNPRRIISRINRKEISTWGGINTTLKDLESIPDGVSPDSLNWITTDLKDAIMLRRGQRPLGNLTNEQGKVSGLGVGKKNDGTEIPFFSTGTKLYYYDSISDSRVEIGTDVIPASAANNRIYIKPYHNLTGSYVYISSPYMNTLKIATANPGSYVDMLVTDFRGYLNFNQSRSFLWKKNTLNGQIDYTSLFLSWVDKYLVSDYTETKAEVFGTGNGVLKTFTHILSAVVAPNTGFFVSVGTPIDSGVSITGITNASSAVVRCPGNTLTYGDAVIIQGVVGMTEINNLIGYVSALGGVSPDDVTISINSTSFTAWSSGGKIYKAEVLKDDKNGNLASTQGGTGTINYATGACSATFFNTPTNTASIVCDYFLENANVQGVLDFSTTFTGGARNPGTGDALQQFAGSGQLNVVKPLSNVYFCFHDQNTWQTSIPTDDSSNGRTNLPYRDRMGSPSLDSAYPGSLGIYFVDFHDKTSKPEIRRLEVYSGGASAVNTIVPKLLSQLLDLTSNEFDEAVIFEWGRYVLVGCKSIKNGTINTFNDVVYLYNIVNGVWDKLNYPISCLENYLGTIIAGDPITKDIYTLFSGFDDNGANITNYWTSKLDNLGWKGQKRVRRMIVDGLIQPMQKIRVSLAFDGGAFVPYAVIKGNGSYVNSSLSIAVGTHTIGSTISGGGDTEFASPFWVEFPLNTPQFQYIRVKFEADFIESPTDVVGGYIQINSYCFEDFRIKGNKSSANRIANISN